MMQASQGMGFSLAKEFTGLRLGDRRLEKRFIHVMNRLMRSPTQSIYEAMGSWSEAKAAYRLFDHEKLKEETVLDTHRKAVVKRIENLAEVLVVQDTTSLVYTKHVHARGLGSLAQGVRNKNSKGLFFHSSYALTEEGVPLGFLGQKIWSRSQLKEGDELWYTESYRWRAMVYQNADLPKALRARLIYVCDREGDFWDLLSEIQNHGSLFVVRALKQRGSRKNTCSLTNVERAFISANPAATVTERITTRESRNGIRAPAVTEDVRLEISFVEYDLNSTVYFDQSHRNRDLKIYLVRAKEIGESEIERDPIDWILKTNRPITCLADALKAIRIYQKRWQIETFHKVLKSGCNVEKSRLEDVQNIQKYVTAMSIVAWRLHAITLLARRSEQGEESCESVLAPIEWKALYCQVMQKRKPPKNPPTLKQAVRWIAQLGGFYGRKGDGEPGVQTLWRGWKALGEITLIYELLADP